MSNNVLMSVRLANHRRFEIEPDCDYDYDDCVDDYAVAFASRDDVFGERGETYEEILEKGSTGEYKVYHLDAYEHGGIALHFHDDAHHGFDWTPNWGVLALRFPTGYEQEDESSARSYLADVQRFFDGGVYRAYIKDEDDSDEDSLCGILADNFKEVAQTILCYFNLSEEDARRILKACQ